MLEELLQSTLALLRSNPVIALVAAAIVVIVVCLKPKEMFKLVLFGLFMAMIFYFITLITQTVNTGSKEKNQMIYKSKDLIRE